MKIIDFVFILILLISCSKEEFDGNLSFENVVVDNILHPVDVEEDRRYIYGSDGMVDVHTLSGKGEYMWFEDQKWYRVEGDRIVIDACGDGPPYESWLFEIPSNKEVIINRRKYTIK